MSPRDCSNLTFPCLKTPYYKHVFKSIKILLRNGDKPWDDFVTKYLKILFLKINFNVKIMIMYSPFTVSSGNYISIYVYSIYII